ESIQTKIDDLTNLMKEVKESLGKNPEGAGNAKKLLKEYGKDLKKEESKYNKELERAKQLDNVINKFIDVNKEGLTHTDKGATWFTAEDRSKKLDVVKAISDYGVSQKKTIKILFEINDLTKSTDGEKPYGQTKMLDYLSNETAETFKVELAPKMYATGYYGTMANEMGDVMFDTAFKDKGFGKADKDKITDLINNKDSKYYRKTPQEVHDAIYKELNSTNLSFYIENIFNNFLIRNK
ncbi:MAG TPA: hypothetical protein PKE52_08105, partial [Bacteroidales bacterium]|nr:hypothetical protein [Bacteroidales bacterium]